MPTTSAPHVFRRLHAEAAPLLRLPNAWDAASALLLAQAGARAVATSSAALAWALGYADGDQLPRAELLAAVRRIQRVLRVPLSVDMESGYSDSPGEVAALARELADCGVAGINLEDGSQPPALLADKIAALRAVLPPERLFINARTDVYLRGLATRGPQALQMTLERLARYHAAGADGAFVPGLAALADVAELVAAQALPLNLMLVPGLPPAEALAAAGVRRLSLGTALFQQVYGQAQSLATQFLAGGDVAPLLAPGPIAYGALNAAFAERAAPRD